MNFALFIYVRPVAVACCIPGHDLEYTFFTPSAMAVTYEQ
jgi:hypothetical protein